MTALTTESLRRLAELGTRSPLYGPGVASVSKSEYARSFTASIDLDEKDDWDVSSKASTEVVIFDRPAPTRPPIRRALTDVGGDDSDDERRIAGLPRRASDCVAPAPGTLEKASESIEPKNALFRARLDVARAELRLKQELRENLRSQRSDASGDVPSSTKAASVGGEESARKRSGSLHYKPQKPTYLQHKPNRSGGITSPPSSRPPASYSAYNPNKSGSTKSKPKSEKRQSRSQQPSLDGTPMRDSNGDESDDDRLSSATFSHAPRHASPAPTTRSSSPDLVELTTSGSLHGSSVPPSPIDPEAMCPSVSPALASPSSRRRSTRGRRLSRLYGSRSSSRTGTSSGPRAAWSPLTSPSASSAPSSVALEEKSGWSRSRKSPSPGAGTYVENPASRRSFLDRTLDRVESRVSVGINKHLVRAGHRPLSSFEVKRVSKRPVEDIASWQIKSLPPPPATASERLDKSVPTASGVHRGGQQEPTMQDRKKLVSPYRASFERAANDIAYRCPAKKASDELFGISHQLRSSIFFEPSWATTPSNNAAAPSSPPPPPEPLRRGASPDLTIDTKFTESPTTMPVDATDSNFENGGPPSKVKALRRTRRDSLFLGSDITMKLAQDYFFPGPQPIAPVSAPVSTNSNAAPTPLIARPQSQFQPQSCPYRPRVSKPEGPVESGSVGTDDESILPDRPLDLARLPPPDVEALARDYRDVLPSQISRPSPSNAAIPQRRMLTRKAGNRSLR
ncbi:hypothetical protein DL765_008185 [Monosporascus sp. GIB2]|nr:hypothetical protein DL765_008185 [Monosporascus sp. GIB2]